MPESQSRECRACEFHRKRNLQAITNRELQKGANGGEEGEINNYIYIYIYNKQKREQNS